jgi:glycosyltransferase involved in cell wall biosynthesis
MKKSFHIFTVSKFSNDRISFYFKKWSNKLSYCYNGTDEYFKTFENLPALKKENYILYVGNIKEHKGLKTLLEEYDILKQKSNLKLYLVGDKDSLKNKDDSINKYLNNDGIIFTGKLNDDALLNIERKAKFLIQPSLYEGFGLTPLEALYLKTKPIISNIEVFKEVFNDLNVEFFEAGNSSDLANKILDANPEVNPDYKYMNEKFNFKNICNELEKEFLK